MSLASLSLAACSEEDASQASDGGSLAPTASVRDGGVDASVTTAKGMDSGAATKLSVDNGDGDESSWVKFEQDAGVENPAANISGKARAVSVDGGGMQVTLEVEGLPSNQVFGSHLHQLDCDEMRGGPHYQNEPGEATDPEFANPMNEVWLDLETDEEGAAKAEATVAWVPRKGEARSIVVHERATGEGGVAGGRLACTPMPF